MKCSHPMPTDNKNENQTDDETFTQQTYRARVVDAETGDALPYAQVYISEMNGALTDGEGWFTVEAKETDVPPVLERIPRCGLVGGIFVNNHF